jgi:hypothetical protein
MDQRAMTNVSNTEFNVQTKVINLENIKDKPSKEVSFSKRPKSKNPL